MHFRKLKKENLSYPFELSPWARPARTRSARRGLARGPIWARQQQTLLRMATAAPGQAAPCPRPIKGGSRACACALAPRPLLRAATSLLRAPRRSRSCRRPAGAPPCARSSAPPFEIRPPQSTPETLQFLLRPLRAPPEPTRCFSVRPLPFFCNY
jgi:hypothetical protein